MVTKTKGYRAALAAAACGAMLVGTAASASAVQVPLSTTAKVVAVTPAKKADDAAASAAADAKKTEAAAKKAAADAKAASEAAKKATDAVDRAKSLAAKKAAADASGAAADAKKAEKAAEKAAEAAERAKVLAAEKEAAAAKKLAAQKAAEAAEATKLAEKAAKDAKDAKDSADIPGAPLQLTVERNPATGRDFTLPKDFTVSWGAPTGTVKQYVVTVFADGTPTVYPVTTTSLQVIGRDMQTEYRIEVASQDAKGRGATSTVMLEPATPGAPSGVTATASAAGIQVSWSVPLRQGITPSFGYIIRMKDMTSGDVCIMSTTPTTVLFSEVNPTHPFEVAVKAVNYAGIGASTDPKFFDLTSTAVSLSSPPRYWCSSERYYDRG